MVTFNEREYGLDPYGFLETPDQWDENFAQGMAAHLGLQGGLTGEHWRLLYYLRKKYLEERTVPLVYEACKANRLKLKRLRGLFPTGYFRGACKIAGINFAFMLKKARWLTFETSPGVKEEHQVTENGFLANFDKWNERFVHRLARDWELPQGLTEKHWDVLRYLREHYQKTRSIPTIFKACRAMDMDLRELEDLFPQGYRRGACRAAGLPFLS
ncbi:MAG: TusE/DsrC/DsvC family sulfur relay protein [Planctomycetota bacterium]|jgi:tRNA 2-thiouridine synthesizing protein E